MSLSPTYFAPAQLRAGDGLDFLVSAGVYVEADSWTPVAVFVSDDGQTRQVITGSYYTGDLRFTATAAETRAWATCSGVLTCFVSSATDRHTVLTRNS